MPPLQPHEPRVRYRLGEKVRCANQAEEDALGDGWSRYPQPASEVEEALIFDTTEPESDVMSEQEVDTAPALVPKRKRARRRKAR